MRGTFDIFRKNISCCAKFTCMHGTLHLIDDNCTRRSSGLHLNFKLLHAVRALINFDTQLAQQWDFLQVIDTQRSPKVKSKVVLGMPLLGMCSINNLDFTLVPLKTHEICTLCSVTKILLHVLLLCRSLWPLWRWSSIKMVDME